MFNVHVIFSHVQPTLEHLSPWSRSASTLSLSLPPPTPPHLLLLPSCHTTKPHPLQTFTKLTRRFRETRQLRIPTTRCLRHARSCELFLVWRFAYAPPTWTAPRPSSVLSRCLHPSPILLLCSWRAPCSKKSTCMYGKESRNQGPRKRRRTEGGRGRGRDVRMTSESTPLNGISRQHSYRNVKEGDQTGSRCNRRGFGWGHRPREQYIPAAHSRRKRRVRLHATPRRWQRRPREGREGVGVSGRDTRFMTEMM